MRFKIDVSDLENKKNLFITPNNYMYNSAKLLSFAAKALDEKYIYFLRNKKDPYRQEVYFYKRIVESKMGKPTLYLFRINFDWNWGYSNVDHATLKKEIIKDNCMSTAKLYWKLINNTYISHNKKYSYTFDILPILKQDFKLKFPNYFIEG